MHYTVASLVQAAFGRIRSLRTPRGTRVLRSLSPASWGGSQRTEAIFAVLGVRSFGGLPKASQRASGFVSRPTGTAPCTGHRAHSASNSHPIWDADALKVKPLNRGDLTPCQKISAVYLKQSKFNFRGELYSMLSPSETVEFSRVSGSTGSVIGAVPPAGTSAGRMAGRVYARRHTKRQVRTESRAPTRTSCSSCCSRAAAAGGGGSTSAPELPSAPR